MRTSSLFSDDFVLPSSLVSPSRLLGAPAGVIAQALKDVKTSDKPLVLKAQGSFFVGGEKVEQTAGELGDLGPGGHITVNQMYVHYMVPQGGDGNVPVVMVHGATPDGEVVGDDAGRTNGMGRGTSFARAIPSTFPIRWGAADRASTRRS